MKNNNPTIKTRKMLENILSFKVVLARVIKNKIPIKIVKAQPHPKSNQMYAISIKKKRITPVIQSVNTILVEKVYILINLIVIL